MMGKTFSIQSCENILKAVREKCKSHTKENSHLKITSNFSVEILKARRAWKNVFQVLKTMMASLDLYTQQNYLS